MTESDFREIETGSILSEDGTLKFLFVPSLTKIALAKVASLLWMSQSIQQEIVNLFHSGRSSEAIEFDYEWEKIQDNVVTKMSELYLPKTIPVMLKKTILALGYSILYWIKYHDSIYFKNSKYSSADLISHITWTDRGRIDLTKTAKNILANQGVGLSDDQKYKIACTYCLEDEIAVLAPKVLNQNYLDGIDIAIFPMVYYWTTYVTGVNIKLYDCYNNDIQYIDDNISINEYLIKLLISDKWSNNIIPITKMWNRLSEQEKAKNVTLLIEFDNQDLRYSLLSNLDYKHQQDVFKECSGVILVGILKDWLYEEYFFEVALHVLDIMDPVAYYSTLLEIIDKMENNYLIKEYKMYKDFFKKFWQGGSRHLKDYNFANKLIVSLLRSFSWEKDSDLIDLVFKDVYNAQQRKKIIFDEYSIDLCSQFILDDKWDSLELFMKHTLSSEEDRIEFKRTLASYHTDENPYYIHLLYEEYDKIKRFMEWAFKSEEEMDHFRQSLVSQICLETFLENNKVDFTKMENYLTWCANGDLELINKFKSEILKKLIKKDQYDLLDDVLNWCYLGNQQQIAQFKCNIAGYLDDDVYMHDDDDDDDNGDRMMHE